MAKLPHTRAAMRVFYAFWQVAELAAGYRYTTGQRNGGGIHDMVGDAVCLQKPMEPEAFATGFIATDHRRGFRETEATFGLGNFVEHVLWLPCGHGALTRLLTRPGGEAELPSFFTQFKGHKQDTCCRALLHIASRWGGHGLSPP